MFMYFSKIIKKIIRLFSLRERYVYRRDNRLRLRYKLMPAFLLFSISLGFGAPYLSHSASVAVLASENNTFKSGTSSALIASETIKDETHSEEEVRYSDTLDLFRDEQGQIRRGRTARKAAALVQSYAMQFRNAGSSVKERTIEIGKGDTLAGVLQKAGVSSREAYKAVHSMKAVYDPRSIKPGQKISVRFDGTEEDGERLKELKMAVGPLKTISIDRDSDSFEARIDEKESKRTLHAASAKIETSLFGSAEKAGIPVSVAANAMKLFSWSVDFQRDIRTGDQLELLYDNYVTEDGHVAKNGEVIYAKMILSGKEIPVYRFKTKDGRVDYFQPDGQSIRKALLRTPVDGARVSSGFGMRRHPVLGYSKMHKGMDFAASRGTPIYAAGDAVVEKAGRWGSYGKYVRLRHNGKLKSAYAHMSRIAKGVTPGKRVKQGQVIGYVGTTGRSTGPHLHYEVLVHDKQVNPMSVDLPTGEILKGKDLERLKRKVREIDQEYAALSRGMKLAQASSSKSLQ